ncbi:MAG: GNAT family N-acetyltransferase [Ilumatobacter sp.]
MPDAVPLHDSISAADLAAVAAPLQARPDRFQAYFGDDAAEITAEIEKVPEWRTHTVVAFEGDALIGWLIAEHDAEIGRVWWWGPVVAAEHHWSTVAETLLDDAIERLDGRFEQFEFAVDGRHVDAIELAQRRGHRRDIGSVLLELTLSDVQRPVASAVVDIAELADADADAVARLHDALFPDSHLTGRQLVAEHDGLVLVARLDERPLGYLRAEVQPGGDGYLDFVGVDAEHRSRGIGRALVDHAVTELASSGADRVSLTVREDNASARALYARLGFDGDRILVPLRLGFGA